MRRSKEWFASTEAIGRQEISESVALGYNYSNYSMSRADRVVGWFLLLMSLLSVVCAAQTQSKQKASTQPAQKVPVMDGGAGPCSLELTVTGPDGNPVYAAIVKVHMAYGFAGIRRLDLEAGTNTDGKVKFTGLPSRVHRPPLEFHASKDQMSGMATYDPESLCQAKHDILLEAPKPASK